MMLKFDKNLITFEEVLRGIWTTLVEILKNPLKSSENGVFGITFRQTLEKV
jgi:hypothetical protein